MDDGGDLRNYMTSRYAASMVFLSLLMSAELGVLFNSSQITTNIRHSMQEQAHFTLQFWIGFIMLISIILTLLSLFITFTAWGMVSAISNQNAHCILRSSIGQYTGELPHRFIIASVYSFLLWVMLMIFLLIPLGFWSILLSSAVSVLFLHVVTVFSAFGRLILHTSAMAPQRIFEESYEKALTPQPLQQHLHTKALAELSNSTSITRQYRRQVPPLDRYYEVEDLADYLKHPPTSSSSASVPAVQNNRADSIIRGDTEETGHRIRADSTVRFADEIFTSIPPMRHDVLTPTFEIPSLASSRASSPVDASSRRSTSGSGGVDSGITAAVWDTSSWLAGSVGPPASAALPPASTPDPRKRKSLKSAPDIPVAQVTTVRSSSGVSSLADLEEYDDIMNLSSSRNGSVAELSDGDDTFDDLFDPPEPIKIFNPGTTSLDETQHLLSDRSANYSSTLADIP